jgi:hypothetical protein
MRRMNLLAAVGAGLGIAAGAGAMPRDSFPISSANSDGPQAGSQATTVSVNVVGTYPTKFVRIKGTLTSLVNGTYALEASVRVNAPHFTTPVAFTASGVLGYTSLQLDTLVRMPTPTLNSQGQWGFGFFETTDDGPGADARWDNITITLNDGPPLDAADVGPLTPGRQSLTLGLAPGETKWVRFTVTQTVDFLSGTYLDIDTAGSSLTGPVALANDTYAVLFDEEGRIVAQDDDSAGGHCSLMSFGTGTRPAPLPGGQAFAAQNGTHLSTGTYYLMVRGYASGVAGDLGWGQLGASSTLGGSVRVNIRTNTGTSAYCPADFNRQNGVDLLDIFDFLTAWFAGCP